MATNVLLVEDDHTISRLYGTKLDLEGFKVDYAYNGLEALRHLESESPNIILLDLMMPLMDGEEFLRRLRKNPDHQHIPVLILTNLSREEAPKTLWHYGISGYFIKAHNSPKDLVYIISKTLGDL